MEKQYKIIIILTLIILGFTFYWYEWRPSQIRKECAEKALIFSSDYEVEHYTAVYNGCLHEKGLKK